MFSVIFQKEAFTFCFLILLLWPICAAPPADSAGLTLRSAVPWILGSSRLLWTDGAWGVLQIPSAPAAANISAPLQRGLGSSRNCGHFCWFTLCLVGADGQVRSGGPCQLPAGRSCSRCQAHQLFQSNASKALGAGSASGTRSCFFQRVTLMVV